MGCCYLPTLLSLGFYAKGRTCVECNVPQPNRPVASSSHDLILVNLGPRKVEERVLCFKSTFDSVLLCVTKRCYARFVDPRRIRWPERRNIQPPIP